MLLKILTLERVLVVMASHSRFWDALAPQLMRSLEFSIAEGTLSNEQRGGGGYHAGSELASDNPPKYGLQDLNQIVGN